MSVKNAVAVVIGGASGIGCSCAEQFLHCDIKYVAIFDLPNSNGEKIVEEFKNQFGEHRVDFLSCDITDEVQVRSSFDKVVRSLGGFDILVNSAGVLCNGEKWEYMIEANFTGLVRTTLKAIEFMGKHKGGKGGTIINIASIAGLTPVTYYPIYAGTKYAVVGFTNSLALSYDKTNVRMLLMCPGYTTSPLTANLDDFHNPYLSFIDIHDVLDYLTTAGGQMPDTVAKAIVRLIENGENGSICLVHDSKPPYLINIQTLDKLTKHYF